MTIFQTLKDQRQEVDESMQGLLIIPREAEKNLSESSRLIQVVSGVRRCGKSVLIHQFLRGKKFGYVNFDDDRLLTIEANDILAGIYQVYGKEIKTLFFDEIQNLEHWELFVARLHRAGFRLFLTGSNAKLLAKEMATRLTGRHLTVELFPFSFREFLSAKKFSEDLDTTKGRSLVLRQLQDYLQQGGFPEVVLGREQIVPYLRELYRKILERDIIGRYHISYKKTLREMAQAIVSNPAQLVSYGKLRRQFGLGSDHTVKNYLSYLEEAYLLLPLSKFSWKPAEVERSEKKVYGIDVGMTAVVSPTGTNWGWLYEQAVALELFRRRSIAFDFEVYYWRNTEQMEVDFVVRQGRTIQQLIQVCYDFTDEDVQKREMRALLNAGKELRCSNLLVITWEREGRETIEWFGIRGTIRFMPLWKWLLEQPVESPDLLPKPL